MQIDFTEYIETPIKIKQQNLSPTAVKTRILSGDIIGNTTISTLGPYSVANGSSLDVTSTLTNNVNPSIKIAALPFMIVFFETSISSANMIPFKTGYTINGPLAMPVFSDGSNGANLVFRTQLVNNTGGTKNIYLKTNTRVFSGIGSV